MKIEMQQLENIKDSQQGLHTFGPQKEPFGPQKEPFGPQKEPFGPQKEPFGPQKGVLPAMTKDPKERVEDLQISRRYGPKGENTSMLQKAGLQTILVHPGDPNQFEDQKTVIFRGVTSNINEENMIVSNEERGVDEQIQMLSGITVTRPQQDLESQYGNSIVVSNTFNREHVQGSAVQSAQGDLNSNISEKKSILQSERPQSSDSPNKPLRNKVSIIYSQLPPQIRFQYEALVQEDFAKFIRHRRCLNRSNLYLVYIFHLLQSLGIFTTTLSATFLQRELIWLGICFNCIASLIYIYEQINNKIAYKLKQDILAIMQGRYICETDLIDPNAYVEDLKKSQVQKGRQ